MTASPPIPAPPSASAHPSPGASVIASPSAPRPPRPAGARPRLAWAVVLTSVAFFMTTLDALVVITALPSIHRELGGDIGTLQWTVNAYNLAFGAGILTAAALGDRLGRRRVYVSGLALFTLASAVCALAPTPEALIAARTVQGLGGAIVAPLSLTLLTSAFPPHRRGAIIGIWGGIAGLAVASGPLLGGAVTQGLNWHWIFWINVPIGLFAVVASRLRLTESRGPRSGLDLPALVMVSAAVSGLTWALVESSSVGWGSPSVVLPLAGGAVLLALFIGWERRVREPLMPLRLFRTPSFAAAVGAMFLTTAALISAAFLASQYFQFGLGFSPLGAGLRFLPWTATTLVIAPLAGALSDRIGSRTLMVPGLLLQGGGLVWIAAVAGPSTNYAAFLAPFILAGVGVSMVLPSGSAASVNAVAPAEIGKASGILNTLRQFGAVAGVASVTAVFTSHGSLASAATVAGGFRAAVLVSAALSTLGAAVALGVARRSRARAAEGSSPLPSAAGSPPLLGTEAA